MAKKRIVCPECAHRFTTEIEGLKTRRIGVRSKRLTTGQFEYTITAPDAMIETGRIGTIADDLTFTAALAVPVGACGGFVASLLQPDYALQFIGLGASVGVSLAWGWLCAEHNQRLKRVLPWFIEQKEEWATAKDETIGGNVSLTVSHQKRDGRQTGAGRTVQRFGPLPVDEDRFNEWVQGALVGKSLGVSHWTPKAKMFTRPEYDALLAKMTAGSIVANLGGNKGNTLTPGGHRALNRHLEDCGIIPPSPASEDFLGERLAQAKQANGGNTPLPHSGERA